MLQTPNYTLTKVLFGYICDINKLSRILLKITQNSSEHEVLGTRHSQPKVPFSTIRDDWSNDELSGGPTIFRAKYLFDFKGVNNILSKLLL